MSLIEQTIDGKKFCVAFQDEGKFFLSFIDDTGHETELLDVTAILNIDQESLPISDFYEPMITVVFIPDSCVFVSVYHRGNKIQYHFKYSYAKQELVSNIYTEKIENSTFRNFPIKSFFSFDTNNCYTFYR